MVRFEDIILLTQYNDAARQWRLLRQISLSLRDRLVDHGEIPETFRGVVQKLLRLDGAKQAFNEMGLGDRTSQRTSTWNRPAEAQQLATGPSRTNNQYGYRSRQTPATGRQARDEEGEEVILDAALTENPASTPNEQGEFGFPKITLEEWNQRMKNGECAICGSKNHRYREHILVKRPQPVVGRAAFTDNQDDPVEELYLDIEGFEGLVHVSDPVLEGLAAEGENEGQEAGNA